MSLGKGLGSLIPTKNNKVKIIQTQNLPVAKEKVVEISVEEISTNPYQPRQSFEKWNQDELVQSVKEHGILQPLIVTKKGDQYELIAGERRLRAAQNLSIPKVPVIVREASAQQKLELALIENVQRRDLNPLEQAYAYRKLIDEFNLTQEQIAKKLGKSRPRVANILRLLSLPEEIQKAISENKLSEGHAKVILSLPSEGEQLKFFRRISSEKWSVRELENQIRQVKVKKHTRTVSRDLETEEKQELLRRALGTKVTIKKKSRGGSIIIDYYSQDELTDVIKKIIK